MSGRVKALVIIAAVLLSLGYLGTDRTGSPTVATTTPAQPSRPKPPPGPELQPMTSVEAQRFQRDGGRVTVILTLKNTGIQAEKDPLLSCNMVGNSGSVIESKNFTVYERFPPGKTIVTKPMFIGFVNNQAAGGSCSVIMAFPG